jgi:hypothetical protein
MGDERFNIVVFCEISCSLYMITNGSEQGCPTFLYIGAHLTDGCGGAMWRLQ